jgi:hypothetical protein
MTSTVSVLKSVLPDGASSATNQLSIKQAIEDTNDNEYHEESISLSSGVISRTQTRDTLTFQQFSVIVEETGSGSSFQIEWSADQINWYFPDFSNTTYSATGVDGVSTQDIGTTTGICKARYMKVALYNGVSSSTVKVLTTLLH